MAFFAEYSLFFLKIITSGVVIILTLVGILAACRKPKLGLDIQSVNKDHSATISIMQRETKHKKSNKKQLKHAKKLAKSLPSLYLLEFNGDIKASQVASLREEITAILSVAEKNDAVMLKLDSPGGAVNSYGFAASQLHRFREHGINLTVCIDTMAASGGYLMACVADHIVAAPFAIIGSIGVVAQLPNFHRWLKQHNIDIELLTAGEYKRTLTMFAENTDKGRKKLQEDIDTIHVAFRNYIADNRQILHTDLDKIATGEHWLGKDAYALKLVDSLKTSDDWVLERLQDFNIFQITVHKKLTLAAKILKPVTKLLCHTPPFH
ncbi:MAG: protease SohB [Legionellales bacterium RIFCSPHIGHO2_12_FULL_42_9]|nr:MAG: protease SohB [Legionellales bacterium RIFCSPHIGHO2_12_FULL_42_9]